MSLKKIKRYFIILTSGGFFFISIHFYYHVFILPPVLLQEAFDKPVDVIIVPGVPFYGNKWGIVMKCRVYWSVLLYKKGLAKNIIYSGSAVYSPYTEASIMAMYAERLGVPSEHIFIETKAEHTTENLYFSFQLAKQKGFRSIAFATDPFQSQLISPYIKKFKLDVSLIPAVIPVLSTMKMQDPGIEAFKAYQLNFSSIEARESPEMRSFYSKGGRIKIE